MSLSQTQTNATSQMSFQLKRHYREAALNDSFLVSQEASNLLLFQPYKRVVLAATNDSKLDLNRELID